MESKKILLIAGAIAVLTLVLTIIAMLRPDKGEHVPVETRPIAAPGNSNGITSPNKKNPEEFMRKVQEKSQEIQKNYDSSLTVFAEKKWKKFFVEQNGVDNDYLADNLKILSSTVEKDGGGNTLFKIRYRIGSEGTGPENEDYFFMVVSAPKLQELDLSGLKPNTFLSEEDIRINLSKEGFARIAKIQKPVPE